MNRSSVLKLAIAVSVLAALVLAHHHGAFAALQTERLESAFRSLGIWGPVLYVMLFAGLLAFFVPGIVFVVPGGLVWDWPTLFVLSELGATGSAVIGFAFARTVGRGFVEKHLSERAHAYDLAIARNGLRTVTLLRLVFFIAPWLSWLCGLSKVRFRDYLLGSVLGFTPMMLAFTWFGASGLDLLSEQPVLGTLLGVGFLAAAFLVGRTFLRRLQMDMAIAAAEP